MFLDKTIISPRELTVHLGESVRFNCLLDEFAEPPSWEFNNIVLWKLVADGTIPNLRKSNKSIYVDNVTEFNQGFYICNGYTGKPNPVTGNGIQYYSRATLTVKGKLNINNSYQIKLLNLCIIF